MTVESSLLAQALYHAAARRPVFPCKPRGKQPLTRSGFRDATTNEARIREWWTHWPDANLGLPTGAVTGLVVLDVDGDEGAENLRTLERRHGTLPHTASVVTPRGGAHYYFRHPGHPVKSSASVLAPSIDVRGDGGYVLAPPSVGANGRAYEPDERAPAAAPPSWLLAAGETTNTPNRGRAAPDRWVTMLSEGVPEGRRNSDLAALTGHLLRGRISAALAREIVLVVAEARCRPPLDRSEAERIVESIAAAELRHRSGTRR